MKKNVKITFYLLFCFSITQGQKVDSIIKDQSIRLNSLEKKIFILEKNQPQAISLLTEITEVIKNPIGLITKSLLIGGIIFLFFYLLRLIKPDWYTVIIQNWIDRYTGDNVLRREKSILLLYPEASKIDFIERFFNKYKFNYKKLPLNDSYIVPEYLPDIFFVFDENKTLEQDMLTTFLEKHDETLLFYFGQTGAWDFKKSGAKGINSRINLANARAQIFANLMSTLKYHSATARSLPLS